jgi:hypothetical protein
MVTPTFIVNKFFNLYSRGAMYFADLEGKLKQHRAKVTVLSLVNILNAMKKRERRSLLIHGQTCRRKRLE